MKSNETPRFCICLLQDIVLLSQYCNSAILKYCNIAFIIVRYSLADHNNEIVQYCIYLLQDIILLIAETKSRNLLGSINKREPWWWWFIEHHHHHHHHQHHHHHHIIIIISLSSTTASSSSSSSRGNTMVVVQRTSSRNSQERVFCLLFLCLVRKIQISKYPVCGQIFRKYCDASVSGAMRGG